MFNSLTKMYKALELYEPKYGNNIQCQTTDVSVLTWADLDSTPVPSMESLVVQKTTSAKVRFVYRQHVRRITLQRLLLSKFVLYPQKTTFLELLVLYDNQLWCNAKCDADPTFREKFGKDLESINQTLIGTRIGARLSTVRKLIASLKQITFSTGFLLKERNIGSVTNQLRDAVYVIDGELGKPNSSFPPKTFIGKGYGDHGCLRDTAYDGSPHWTEVAMAHLDLLEE